AYQLWEKTSAVTETYVPSSRLQYVELLFNGSYHGIYGLTEPLDGKQVGLSDGDLLYKIRQWPWEFDYLSLYSQREGEMEVENGRGGAAVRMTYPREWTEAADWGPMETFQQFCFKTRDLSTLEEAGIGYDRDSVIQLSLFCSLIQAPDNTWKNSILIAKKVTDETDQNGDSVTAGLRYVLYRDTWDLNYTFGDHSVKPVEMRQTEFSLDRVASFDTGYDCTYDYSTFRAADSSVKQRTLELWTLWRENGITPEYLCGLADTALEELRASGALSREMQRWPQDQDPADAVENMKEWIRQRFAFLDRHYELTH
ncbi:MAG: CotH kinase family protein, partial [Sarcina sp.]|nr:CotH kinase family protein [Sarcina sp.]